MTTALSVNRVFGYKRYRVINKNQSRVHLEERQYERTLLVRDGNIVSDGERVSDKRRPATEKGFPTYLIAYCSGKFCQVRESSAQVRESSTTRLPVRVFLQITWELYIVIATTSKKRVLHSEILTNTSSICRYRKNSCPRKNS